MADNTLTIILDGEVPLYEFAKAIENFYELVKALSRDAGTPDLDWVIDDLQAGSAQATVKEVSNPLAAQKVVGDYEEVGASLETGTPNRFSSSVNAAARKIISISDHRIKSVRLETANREARIPIGTQIGVPAIARPSVAILVPVKGGTAYGAIEGRIQTLSNRGGLRFTLYDLLYDRAIGCYITEGKQEELRDIWGKLAVVEGLITRDPVNGRPMAIRQIREITLIQDPLCGKDYQAARGAAQSLNGLSPEEAIRRIRDEQ